VSPTHPPAEHETVEPGNVQALDEPLHAPAQTPAPGHERAPCGVAAAGRIVHVPALPTTSHASHAPPHARSQQKPSMHAPPTHSTPVVHAAPIGFCATHAPEEQRDPVAQSVSTVQPEGQLVAPLHFARQVGSVDVDPVGSVEHTPSGEHV
jgi:hypothetical protein